MDVNDFREFGKFAVDFIADYLENIRERDVLPSVEPGYLAPLLPHECPKYPEKWQSIMDDINKLIMPGITHWQSPNFHAYYPAGNSYASIVGEMLTAGIGALGFNWMCSPVCTELEILVMDWLAKMLNLPDFYLHSNNESGGGGVLQGSASEAILLALIAARENTVRKLKQDNPNLNDAEIRSRLIAYTSDQSNSAVEKAGILASVTMKMLPSTNNSLLAEALENAILLDLTENKIPIICVATLGTTATCSFDNLQELGVICKKYNIWLHVDAAYAGAALTCPELRPLMTGIEYTDSFNFNLHKCMMVNYDCCAMWLKNSQLLVEAIHVERIYLKHKYEEIRKIPEFRNWQISLGRKFRALKVWIVLRTMGLDKIRENIRNRIELAKRFEKYLLDASDKFSVVSNTLGLVCFRIKGPPELSEKLLDRLTERKKLYLVSGTSNGEFVLRFVIGGTYPTEEDMDFAWLEIHEQTEIILKNEIKKNKKIDSNLYTKLETITESIMNTNHKLSNFHNIC